MKNTLIKILRLAEKRQLPERIDASWIFPIEDVEKLVSGGYLTVISVHDFSKIEFLEPKISVSGLDYLAKLENDLWYRRLSRFCLKHAFTLALTISGSLILAYIAGAI